MIFYRKHWTIDASTSAQTNSQTENQNKANLESIQRTNARHVVGMDHDRGVWPRGWVCFVDLLFSDSNRRFRILLFGLIRYDENGDHKEL